MCGIAGKLSWTRKPDPEALKRMTAEMSRRGPDADGSYFADFIALGHRRLSIIDLSPGGRQPMCDHTGKYWITFNGEIYNYRELKKELTKNGAQFKSNSDTEVILEAYKQWGDACLERLNGMFAFALWDEERRRLLLGRDRLGKKPLFYFVLPDGGLIFSSEMKALLKDPDVPARINPQALGEYLSLSYILSDSSIIRGVQKLEAGHALVAERDKPLKIWRYWDLAKFYREKSKASASALQLDLKNLLEDSCRLRLISDVPLGAFLSGGIDSSAIVASMARLRDPKQVKTYSIGFNEKSYSELPQAREVAEHLRVSHSDKVVEPQMTEILREIVRAADEPFADSSMVPMYYLSEFTRRHVTVALSGDGGDEIFAGYETYAADRLHRLARRIPDTAAKMLDKFVDAWFPITFDKVSLDFKLRRFLAGRALSGERAHYSWRQIFGDEEKIRLMHDGVGKLVMEHEPYDRFGKAFGEVSDCHYLDQAMYVDAKTWLVDDILVKADRMSMAHSLELRCPFLDHRLVEFAAALPVKLKMKGFEKKYLLKRSQEPFLPKNIIYRSKKGFNAPVAHWLNVGLGDELLKSFEKNEAMKSMVRGEEVKRLVEEHATRKQDHSLKLFNILCLTLWTELYL